MLELIVPDAGSVRRGEPFVSVSGKFRRILLFQEAYKLIKREHGEDFDYVQFWSDKDHPDRFWIKPAAKETVGSARIIINQANGTRTISASYVLKALGWECEQSVRCPMEWDPENHAALVIMTTPSL